MRFRRKSPKQCQGTRGHRNWKTISSGENTYIEECAVCKRQRARMYG